MSDDLGVSTDGSSSSGTKGTNGTASACAVAVAPPAAIGAPTTAWIGATTSRIACLVAGRTTTAGPATGAMVAVPECRVVRLAPLLGIGSACPLESATQGLLQVCVEAPERLLRHSGGRIRLQAVGPACSPIDDDVDAGVVESDPARAFTRSRRDRRRQGGDQLMRPLRPEVFQVCTRRRLLRVGRNHATVEDAHGVFGSVGNELLEE